MSAPAATIDPRILASQATFRAVMKAMAEPGTIHAVSGSGLPSDRPGNLSVASQATLLTLCDASTPVFSDIETDQAFLARWTAFHTGAPMTNKRADAHFALLNKAPETLDGFAVGTDKYPDRSTTLIVETGALEGPTAWTLTGPGINGEGALPASALSGELVCARAPFHALFPCGLDFILCHGDKVAALPRTTRIKPATGG